MNNPAGPRKMNANEFVAEELEKLAAQVIACFRWYTTGELAGTTTNRIHKIATTQGLKLRASFLQSPKQRVSSVVRPVGLPSRTCGLAKTQSLIKGYGLVFLQRRRSSTMYSSRGTGLADASGGEVDDDNCC